MNKVANYISNINSIILLMLFVVIMNLNNDTYLNGINFILLMSMLMINPVCNLYHYKKKQINYLFYHLILNISLIYIIYNLIMTIYIHYVSGINESSLFIYNKLWIIGLLILINFILTFFFKKEIIISKDNSKIMYLVIFLISLLGINNASYIHSAISGITMAMSLILFIKRNDMIVNEEYRKIYFVLILMTLYNCDFISTILFIQMYINLDKFGLNI